MQFANHIKVVILPAVSNQFCSKSFSDNMNLFMIIVTFYSIFIKELLGVPIVSEKSTTTQVPISVNEIGKRSYPCSYECLRNIETPNALDKVSVFRPYF